MKTIKIKGRKKLFYILEDAKPVELTVEVEKASNVEVLIVSKGIKKEKHEVKLLVIHKHPDSSSSIQMNAVLYDEADVKMYGSVVIENDIHDVAADLKQRAVLMSEKAKIVLDPVLEIDDNRLTGSHAAVISAPDPAHIYYLQSRGLTEEQAKESLVEGLLNIPPGYTKMEVF